MRSKYTAALLAFLLGMTGAHRFYLGELSVGSAYLVVLIISFVFTFLGVGVFGLIALLVLAIADGVNILAMTEDRFERKYNKGHKPV